MISQMFKSFVRILIVALIFTVGGFAQFLANTGESGIAGNPDSNWKIVSVPAGTKFTAGSSAIIMSPNAKWANPALLNTLKPVKWIGLTSNGNQNLPKGKYSYQLSFNSANFVSVSANFYTDNRVESVIVWVPSKTGLPKILQSITSFSGGNSYTGTKSSFSINSFGGTTTYLTVTVINDGTGGPSGLALWFDAPASPPSKRPTVMPTNGFVITNGLFAQYSASSFKTGDSVWKDLSGNGRDASVSGRVTRGENAVGRASIMGDTTAVVTFPISQLPKTSYTLFHRARYNGVNKQRIFASSYKGDRLCEYYFGFYDGYTGVARHGGRTVAGITAFENNVFGSDWGISTDQFRMYRANGQDYTGPSNHTATACDFDLGINLYTLEESDWAVSEVLLYNRELSIEEIRKVEAYLDRPYS